MATVSIVACTTAPNITTNTYSSWCPASNRRVLQVDDVELQAAALEIGIKPESIDPQRVDDIYLLFMALLAVLVSVWLIKRLLALFTGDLEKD
jgi:hypothetical protein